MLAELLRTGLGKFLHLCFRAEVQASGRTGFDARRFKSLADPVRTERALKHLLRRRVEFGNVERTAGDAIATTNTVVLLKIHDAIRILHDSAIGRARR